jgi:hypothetical protein
VSQPASLDLTDTCPACITTFAFEIVLAPHGSAGQYMERSGGVSTGDHLEHAVQEARFVIGFSQAAERIVRAGSELGTMQMRPSS